MILMVRHGCFKYGCFVFLLIAGFLGVSLYYLVNSRLSSAIATFTSDAPQTLEQFNSTSEVKELLGNNLGLLKNALIAKDTPGITVSFSRPEIEAIPNLFKEDFPVLKGVRTSLSNTALFTQFSLPLSDLAQFWPSIAKYLPLSTENGSVTSIRFINGSFKLSTVDKATDFNIKLSELYLGGKEAPLDVLPFASDFVTGILKDSIFTISENGSVMFEGNLLEQIQKIKILEQSLTVTTKPKRSGSTSVVTPIPNESPQ